ncbi:MAG TPA: peptidylprolyl isomerase [Gaiellaceae bacterium]|nr:peptidylprolyl isomerase [Gaiellaceae bacterium]
MRGATLLVVLALGLAAGCGGGDDDEPAAEAATTSVAATTTAAAGACATVEPPAPREDGGATAPDGPLETGTTYRLVVETNCGPFTITLDQSSAPETTASLVALARDGFFDGTSFHRVVPGFVIQGGDPTGTGTGGPGYQTVDPPPQDTAYTRGVVAMAKTGAEAPGTSGSQFFVVTGPDAGLPPDYAVVGTVTAGLDTVLAIDGLGVGDGPPSMPVVVEKVTVEES